jgi:hypothetical protein
MSQPFGDQNAVLSPNLVVSMEEFALVTALGTLGRCSRGSELVEPSLRRAYGEEPDSVE